VVGDNDSEDTESQLDVTIASVIADGAELWYWRTNSWLYSFAIAFQHQEPAVPDVLSMSWGWSERDQCSITTCTNETSQQYVDRVNVEYAKLALRGITILASSGDAGAPGRTNEGCESTGANAMNPILPGSSPFVTSVGATFIQQPKRGTRASHWNTAMCKQNGCFEGTTEMSVSFDNIGWTAGGGFSVWSDATPWYQETHVQQYLKAADASLPGNPFNRNGRGYPDVAAIGHACPTFLGGMLSGVDGTSCSSPLFAGIVATLNSYQASRGRPVLGFVNPLFYYMADHCDDCFNGAIEGHNGCTEMQCCGKDFGFASATGANWDPVTGLGTPNVQAMMKWLAQNL
jgi:tripeptidyl-peptidase-1